MRQLLRHFEWYTDGAAYSDGQVYSSGTHLGVIGQREQPLESGNRFYLWVEGEFYNQEELKGKYDVTSAYDGELFLDIYGKTESFDFLRHIDGYYVAVFYDKLRSMVYLITDRYGLKPLYWAVINGNLVWSSELKGFLEYDNFKIDIVREAVRQFFDVGYLLENRTWFEGVELMPPASVLAFNIQESDVKITHYWSWNDIRRVEPAPDETELAEELGRLFKDAVRKRVRKDERIGITLSGGLDSRAILAAVPDDYEPLHTFTFGQEGCQDMAIARRVGAIKAAIHHTLVISLENWLAPRISGVWMSDGSYSLLHMHGSEFHNEIKTFIDFNLNGFAGDLILGGSYLREDNLDRAITPELAKVIMRSTVEKTDFADWYLTDKTDPYFINNRVRRFTNSGSILMAKLIEQRKPFFDNNLIELVYSLSDFLRYKSRIYGKMLLSSFPAYFRDVPWQKTGCPIGYSDVLVKFITFKNRVAKRLRRETGRITGMRYRDLQNYTDYANWLRQEPARSFFENVLYAKDAVYPAYIDKAGVYRSLKGHLEGKENRHDELCAVLTFELWLRQVFEGKYRKRQTL